MLLPLLLSLLYPATSALPLNSPLLDSYDYVIVGGGPGGLTVANRLSEDPTVNVLLLEAGPADHSEPAIMVPGYIGQAIGSQYDWNLSTVPQTYLDGQPRSLPQGRALGGGSEINGMLWNRGGQGDYEDWVELGNEGWGWTDMLPYFIKSETYTPVQSVELAMQYSIQEDPDVHGFSGPVNISFPRYFWGSSSLFFSALNELGVPTAFDSNSGLIAGASFLPLSIDPSMETRSTARRAYYDPVAGRPNLWVSTGQYVTQVLFSNGATNANATVPTANDFSVGQGSSPEASGGIYRWTTTLNITSRSSGDEHKGPGWVGRAWSRLKRVVRRRQLTSSSTPISAVAAAAPSGSLVAIGVEYAPNAQAQRTNITATREVIISAGALHSPQLLMLSGIGPAATLQDLGIPLNYNLPGVGSNLQDHGQSWNWFQYTNKSITTPMNYNDSSAQQDYWTNRTGPYTTNVVDGVAFPALQFIVNGSSTISDQALSQTAQQYLLPNTDATVIAGFAEQLTLINAALIDATRSSYEILNANDGVLSVGTMRPLSRGSVSINSSNPFSTPVVDPRYGSNPVDLQILLAALRFNERLITTESMAPLEPVQISPAAGLSDDAILQHIRANLQTEYHVGGSCAMMPLTLGGVVDSQLLVYGTRNLRVVDASIMPMLPAGHLQAVVYGIGEKAADIIKAAQVNVTATSSATPFTSTNSTMVSHSLVSTTISSEPVMTSSTIETNFMTKSSTSPPAPFATPATVISAPVTTSVSSKGSSSARVTSTTVDVHSPAVLTTFVTVVFTHTVFARDRLSATVLG